MKRYKSAAACVIAGLCATSAPAAIFYQRASIDLAPTAVVGGASEIGTNAVAVAWDGTNAYLAGTNAGSAPRDVGIVKLSNALSSQTFGDRFGVNFVQTTGRGYMNADYKAGVGLATSSWTGPQVTLAVFAPGATTSTFSRVITTGGTNAPAGIAFDAPLRTDRVSYMYQSSANVRNLDVVSGGDAGVLNTNAAATYGTSFRDIDYDANGNLYARVNNNVIRADRTNNTTFAATPTLLVNTADFNNAGENIAVIEGFAGNGTFAIYNDRASTAAGQSFSSVIGGVRANGTKETLFFLNADGTDAILPASIGQYDFSYDAATQSLALLDFGNNRLYIFSAPEPTSLVAILGAATVVLRRRRRR